MGKTRDVFKKMRDTKGTFHAKMGTAKVFLQEGGRFKHTASTWNGRGGGGSGVTPAFPSRLK